MSGRPIRTEGREISRAAAVWLVAVAALILAMIIVGGATRATGSGLSITQWKPVSGVIPPLSRQDWDRLFALYQAIPQYRLVNPDMPLTAFKSIFWWEWSHRMLGRLLGVVFLVPFVVLLALRRIPSRLIGRCIGLFVLGGVQGAVGWWMVESGLEFRTSACIWTALDAWFGPPAGERRARLAWAGGVFLAAVYLQCLLGALVAGNHAGLANADWPLMSGRLIPTDYWQAGYWTSLVHGMAATQFNHRFLAYGLFAAGLAQATALRRGPNRAATALASAILVALVVQIALGVATLLLTVPLLLALAHQFTAAAILALATALAWTSRRTVVVLKYHDG
jgi:heme a synthase